MPEEVYELLSAVAKKRGKSIEEVVVESVAEALDPEEKVGVYAKLHEKYLREAEELYAEKDFVQSGEKYWGAVTALLNAIGVREKLPYYSHRDLKEVSLYLTRAKKDPDYTRLFSSVETLHANYYHGFLVEETFNIHREDAMKLIEKLRKHLGL